MFFFQKIDYCIVTNFVLQQIKTSLLWPLSHLNPNYFFVEIKFLNGHEKQGDVVNN
jgi:hypothetical protein